MLHSRPSRGLEDRRGSQFVAVEVYISDIGWKIVSDLITISSILEVLSLAVELFNLDGSECAGCCRKVKSECGQDREENQSTRTLSSYTYIDRGCWFEVC